MRHGGCQVNATPAALDIKNIGRDALKSLSATSSQSMNPDRSTIPSSSGWKYIPTRQFVIGIVVVAALAGFLFLALMWFYKDATRPVSAAEEEKLWDYWASRNQPNQKQ